MASKRPFPSYLLFRDKEGSWRWNFAGPGGRVLAASSQTYPSSAGCIRAIQMLKGSANIPVVGRGGDVEAAREAAKAVGQGAQKAKPEAEASGDDEAKAPAKKADAPADKVEQKKQD